MKFTDAPLDVQKILKRNRTWHRPGHMPPNGAMWWNDRKHCEMCGDDTGRLVWDHCHATGVIRGRLCPSCNVNEGFKNGPEWKFWRTHAPGFAEVPS